MEPDEANVKNEQLYVHWSQLSVQDRCNRLLSTLSQRKKGVCVPCSMCDHMKPSDRRTAHEVHFLSHHTTESDTKEEVFGYAGIPNLPTYDNAWQLSRTKIARRNRSLQETVLTPPSEDGPDCGASFSTPLSYSCTKVEEQETRTIDTSISQSNDETHIRIASPQTSTCVDIKSQSASSLSSTNVPDATVIKLSSTHDSRSDESTSLNASNSQQDTSNSLDANISLDSRHTTSLPEPLNFTSTLHNNSSIIMPNPIYQGIPSSHKASSKLFTESDRQLNSVVPPSASSSSSSLPPNACSVIKGPHILPRNGPLEGTSSFSRASSSSFTPTGSRFCHPSTTIETIELNDDDSSPSQETESTSHVHTAGGQARGEEETSVSTGVLMKRKRGRPRKYFPEMSSSNGTSDGTVVRRKRGRPRKYPPDLINRNSGKSKKSNVALKYTLTGEPVVVRGRGRPRKDATIPLPENNSITISKYTLSSQSNNSSLQEPCLETRFMTEKARDLFLKQCQVSFHCERTKKQQRLEEKRRRLNELMRMEKKLQSQLASELDSDPKSATEEEEEDEEDEDGGEGGGGGGEDDASGNEAFSSADEDEMSTENESNSCISLNQLNNLDPTNESTSSSLNLVPTTLPGIFFTNPNISIEVLPASRKNPTRNVRRHS